jgi:ferric iron reductase protein FhuF
MKRLSNNPIFNIAVAIFFTIGVVGFFSQFRKKEKETGQEKVFIFKEHKDWNLTEELEPRQQLYYESLIEE